MPTFVKVRDQILGLVLLIPKRSRRLIYALGAIAGFLIVTSYMLYLVFVSTNSTAAIGLIFIPVYGAVAAIGGYAMVYVGFAVADVLSRRLLWSSGRGLLASALIVVALLFGGAVLLYRNALAVASDPQSQPDELMAVSQRWIPLRRENVIVELAKNPATPGNLLTAIAEAGQNSQLVSLVGANPGTPLPTLEMIAAGPRNYERVAGLAENPHITPAIVERLANVARSDFRDDVDYRLYQTFVLAELARNPATPQLVFDRLAARDQPEYFLAVAIIYTDRATCAQIARVAEKGDEVLRNTAQSQLQKRGC